VSKNEVRAALGLPPVDESEDERQRRLKGQLEIVKAAVDATIPLETALDLAGLDLSLPKQERATGEAGVAEEPVKGEGEEPASDIEESKGARKSLSFDIEDLLLDFAARLADDEWEALEAELEAEAKHLAGRHNQQTHAGRYGAGFQRTKEHLRKLDKADREKFKQRARERGFGGSIDRALPGQREWEEQRERQRNPKAITKAFGSDPNRVYEFETRVVDLDDLITSNTDSGGINPDYDPTLQPRQRSRVASQQQIDKVAREMVPESMLWDFHQLDKGAPIVGEDGMVESGNGRTMALRRARERYPEQWAAYQASLRQNLAASGLSEKDLEGVKNPVLVRERVSKVDRAAFAREANAPPVLQMSALETALVDSGRISDSSLQNFKMGEGQTIDMALRSRDNKAFVDRFMGHLSDNERAALMRADGTLNQMGLFRMKAAVFARVFPGEAGQRISDTFLESLDSNVKNFETAISATLPKLAHIEGLIQSGRRDRSLSINEDVSRSLNMLARLRESGMSVSDYVRQGSLFDKELTPFQEQMLVHFDRVGRKPTAIKDFFNRYADAVEAAPDPDQGSMFDLLGGDGGMAGGVTKESIFASITAGEAP
jgi:hypothetical protein